MASTLYAVYLFIQNSFYSDFFLAIILPAKVYLVSLRNDFKST